MDNQTDIDVLFRHRRESVRQDLMGICNYAGLTKDRVDALMKSVDALCGLYLLQQLQRSKILSEDTIAKFAHEN